MGAKINCLVLKSIWSLLYSILMIYIATSHLRSQWVRGCITPFTFAITTMKFRFLLTWTVHEDFLLWGLMEHQGCMNPDFILFLWGLWKNKDAWTIMNPYSLSFEAWENGGTITTSIGVLDPCYRKKLSHGNLSRPMRPTGSSGELGHQAPDFPRFSFVLPALGICRGWLGGCKMDGKDGNMTLTFCNLFWRPPKKTNMIWFPSTCLSIIVCNQGATKIRLSPGSSANQKGSAGFPQGWNVRLEAQVLDHR